MKIVPVIAVAVILSGCTAMEKREWVGVGGSKADGTVVLGIDVQPKMGVRETEIEWDISQANEEASRRCRNWGYSGAEVFKGNFPVQVTCYPQGISPCWSKTYRVLYQCVGDKMLDRIIEQRPNPKREPADTI